MENMIDFSLGGTIGGGAGWENDIKALEVSACVRACVGGWGSGVQGLVQDTCTWCRSWEGS